MDFVKGVSVLEMESYPLFGFRDMPEVSGVYFVFDNKGIVWYVGQTQNLRRRFELRHDHLNEFLSFVAYARVAYTPVNGAKRREDEEFRYIKQLAPDLNVMHRPSNVPTWSGGRCQQYLEFIENCAWNLTEEGCIPFEDYHRWVLGAEPLFPEEWVKARCGDALGSKYQYCLDSKDKMMKKYLTPEYLVRMIYDHFWRVYRQPQYEVPKLPRKVKAP